MRRRLVGVAYLLIAISLTVYLILAYQNADWNFEDSGLENAWCSRQNVDMYLLASKVDEGEKHSAGSSQPRKGFVRKSSESRLPCPTFPIVVGTDGGRLGNKIWEYAATWSLAQFLGRPAFVPQSMLTSLDKLFSNLSLFPLESISHCNLKYDHSYDWSELLPVKKLRRKLGRQHLLLNPWLLIPEPVLMYRNCLPGEFHYRTDVVNEVKDTFREVGGDGKVLIGIHVRRTDFDKFLPKYFSTTLVGKDFYLDAMDWYRENVAGPLLFLIVSDDLKWCEENLVIIDDIVIASKSPEHDMVLLSACDHRIIDYGTFGYWGALMGSGHTISLNVDKSFNKAMVSKVENWHLFERSKYTSVND